MLYRPNNHPLNWYQYEMSSSVELLDAYVTDIERQVAKCIADYTTNVKHVVVDEHLGDEAVRIVRVHNGLDDETWHLPEIFEIYFPNLQRRSALITLYSFFEHELDKLCERLRKHENIKVRIADMANTGVKRSVTYLEKVVGVEGNQQSPIWSSIQDVRKIRNLVVHADGRLLDDAGIRKKTEDAIIAKTPLLGGTNEVQLKEGYLAHVLETIDQYFKLVEKSIKAKYCT